MSDIDEIARILAQKKIPSFQQGSVADYVNPAPPITNEYLMGGNAYSPERAVYDNTMTFGLLPFINELIASSPTMQNNLVQRGRRDQADKAVLQRIQQNMPLSGR